MKRTPYTNTTANPISTPLTQSGPSRVLLRAHTDAGAPLCQFYTLGPSWSRPFQLCSSSVATLEPELVLRGQLREIGRPGALRLVGVCVDVERRFGSCSHSADQCWQHVVSSKAIGSLMVQLEVSSWACQHSSAQSFLRPLLAPMDGSLVHGPHRAERELLSTWHLNNLSQKVHYSTQSSRPE